METLNKYVLIGSGIILSAAALWFLSRDDDSIKPSTLNSKLYTKEGLRMLYKDIFVRSATLYCQKLNQIRKLKQQGQMTDKILDQMKTQ